MDRVLKFFDGLIKKLGKDITWTNMNGDEMPCDNYMADLIPINRVIEDKKKCINMVEKFFYETKNNSERELILAIYCNFYIKYGMAGRLEKEKKEDVCNGLENIFNSLNSEDMYLQDVYNNVKTQNDNGWEEILRINKESIVAKIYIFVKLCFHYCQEAKKSDEKVVDVDKYAKMWELYESIPEIWQNYLIGEGELYKASSNYAYNHNLLPYMQFKSTKEILMEYIPKYYSSVLDKLGINRDEEPGKVYTEFLKKLGILSTQTFISKVTNKLTNADISEVKRMEVEFFPESFELILNIWNQTRIANENNDMIFLVEKIHDLQFEYAEEWRDNKWILDKYSFYEMNYSFRQIYLHLPVKGSIKKSLFLSQYNEYLKNRVIKRNTEQKKEMMDYYAHSWKHISYPQIVKEIAEELGDSNRIIANRLMKVYNSEKTLQRGIQLLQYISSEDEGKVSKEFRNGIAKSGANPENYVTLQEVLSDSLDLVVFKILMVESDDSRSIEKCREKWNLKRSMDDLREEYTEIFLNGNAEEKRLIEWVNDNLLNINLKVENEWDSVRFRDDSFAVNQFKEILVEIFTNVFLHGEESMTLEFTSTDNEMIIYEKNDCDDTVSGSKSGISTMEKVLEYINHGTDIKSLEITLGELFEITIRINKKLLIRRGR